MLSIYLYLYFIFVIIIVFIVHQTIIVKHFYIITIYHRRLHIHHKNLIDKILFSYKNGFLFWEAVRD